MKIQPISKELLKRKLDKLDDWRTSINCDVLPKIWEEFVQDLCSRGTGKSIENYLPRKRFADSFSKEAYEYRAKLRAENEAEFESRTGPRIDRLIARIESVWSDAPLVLRTELEEARTKFDTEAVKKLLHGPVASWSVREVGDPMPEVVKHAHRLLFAAVVSVIDEIEAGLTVLLSSRQQSVDGKTTPEVRARIREIGGLNSAVTREDLLQIVKSDPVIKKLGFGDTLNFNQLQHALSARSKKRDRK
jgi:hypothetical protein